MRGAAVVTQAIWLAGKAWFGHLGRVGCLADLETASVARRLLTILVLLLGYGIVTAWLSWPLATRIATDLPYTAPASRYDPLYSIWAMAYASHRLITEPWLIAQANIYFPTRNTYFLGPTGLGALPLFMPVFLLFGNPVIAANVLLLAGLAMTAAGVHAVVHRWTGLHAAGFLAALYLLSSRWIGVEFVPTAPHNAALMLFPWIILAASRPLVLWRQALLLALAVALQCLTDIAYVAPAAIAPLIVLGCLRTIRVESRRPGLLLLASVAVSALMLLPLVLGYAQAMRAIPDLMSHSYWPSVAPPIALPQELLRRSNPAGADWATILLVATGGLVALRRRRGGGRLLIDDAWAAGILWTITGIVIAIDLRATLFGFQITTPRQLLSTWLPGVAHLRAASRLGVAALFGESILAGAPFAEICALLGEWWTRLDNAGVRAGFAAMLVACALVAQAPRSFGPWLTWQPPTAPSSFVAALRQKPGPVLVLPTGDLARPGDPKRDIAPFPHARAMFESIAHRQPLLNGYSSYFPGGFVEEMAIANRLPELAALHEIATKTGLRYVWVRFNDLPADRRRSWYVAALYGIGGLTVVAQEGNQVLFSVPIDTAR